MAFQFIIPLILFAVSLAASILLAPKPKLKNATAAGLGDFSLPTATEGRVVPVLWGTVKVTGPNVVWYGDFHQVPIKQKVKSGMFSSKKIIIGYKYKMGMQFALCRGGTSPVDEMLRFWIGEKLIHTGSLVDGDTHLVDEPNANNGLDYGSGEYGVFRFHAGSMSQSPNAYLAAFQSVGGVSPAYLGTCMVVWEGGQVGNQPSLKPYSFEIRRIPNGLGLAIPGVNSGNDANPMNVIYELLTNTEWGSGQPSGDIDTANFIEAAELLETEGNGFSLLLDSETPAQDLLRMIEQQIDGVLNIDPTTGKFRMTLARGGYTLSAKQPIDETNILSVDKYTRGAWDDTINQVFVNFSSRALEYNTTYAQAQDGANMRLQGNRLVTLEQTYPGVKDPALANAIAWRTLRTAAYPLVRAQVTCDRSLSGVSPGDVLRWSSEELGFTDLPMRVSRADRGTLTDGKVVLELVQDVFVHDAGSFAAPGGTSWTPPSTTIGPVPVNESLVFEAPRAFVVRDSGYSGRIFVGGRWQGDAAVDMEVWTRPGSGSYAQSGSVPAFMAVGELDASLAVGGTQGSITITVNPASLSDVETLQDDLFETASFDDVGVALVNLVMIGNEFFVFKSAVESSGSVVLSGGYRGVLDSVQGAHTAGDKVFIVSGAMTDSPFADGETINVKLLPRGASATLAEGSATAINVVMDDRFRKPYPPANFTANSTLNPTSVDIDTANAGGPGTGLDDRGIAVSFIRRDFRNYHEAEAVVSEAIPAGFLADTVTEYAVEVRDDPSGANTLLFTTDWNDGSALIEISRTRILRATGGALPANLGMRVHTRHDYEGDVLEAIETLRWDFAATASVLSTSFNLGALDDGTGSSSYSAIDTGTFTLTLGAALSTGDVEVRVSAGAWTPVVLATTTSGTFAAAFGDTIEVRHNQAGSNDSETFCALTFSGGSRAYAILTY